MKSSLIPVKAPEESPVPLTEENPASDGPRYRSVAPFEAQLLKRTGSSVFLCCQPTSHSRTADGVASWDGKELPFDRECSVISHAQTCRRRRSALRLLAQTTCGELRETLPEEWTGSRADRISAWALLQFRPLSVIRLRPGAALDAPPLYSLFRTRSRGMSQPGSPRPGW
jgi:hypothetical protein